MFFMGNHFQKKMARVSITRVIQGALNIPFPVNDKIVTVEQAFRDIYSMDRRPHLRSEEKQYSRESHSHS